MLKFDEEITKWASDPLSSPMRLIETFGQNRFKYLKNFNIDTPIGFCKRVFLPNHLTWFLKEKDFKKQIIIARNIKTSREFFENLIKATAKLYKIQNKVKVILEGNDISDFAFNSELIRKSTKLLKDANKYEVLRVGYNSQIREFIDKKLRESNYSQKELHIILTPTFGTIYTFLAEEYLKSNQNIQIIGSKYFGGSIEDVKIKFPNWREFADKELIDKRNKKLKDIGSEKERLYKENNELVWIDGLITFDNLIDKLIVYSGLLRHDIFLKLALFRKTGLKPEEIFKTKVYSPKEKLSNH